MTEEVEFQNDPVKKQLTLEELRKLSPEDRERARKEGFVDGLLEQGPKFKRDELK